MSETAVQQRGRNLWAYAGPNWRNNSGVLYNEYGTPVRFGLANESEQQNREFKSPDVVGIRSVLVTPDMVGTVVGIFAGIDFKHEGWHQIPSDKRAVAQAAFNDTVIAAGGMAGFAASDDDVRRILRMVGS